MTASRLVMCIAENPQFETVWRIIAWDWETGDLVRRLWMRMHFSHITFLGLKLFDRGQKWIDQGARILARLPRRISDHAVTRRRVL